LPNSQIIMSMKRQQIINATLQKIFAKAVDGDVSDYPVKITLMSGKEIRFRLLSQVPNSILGITEAQSKSNMKDDECIAMTLIPKKLIIMIECPDLET
jgi:hypothetical protein